MIAKTLFLCRGTTRSRVLLDQAAMIQRVNLRTVPEESDQADITVRYEALLKLHAKDEPIRDDPVRP